MKTIRKLFILTLICAMTVCAPISVSAKAKKIAKPYFLKPYTNVELASDGSYKATVPMTPFCSGATKVEIYKSTAEKGKYKKVTTVKTGKTKKISATPGLSFYKAKGINGKKKGSFSSPLAMYCAKTTIKDYKVNPADNSVNITLLVDNSKSENSMTFVNSDSVLAAQFLCDKKITNLVESKYKGFQKLYDESYAEFTGHLVNESGNSVNETTIDANKEGLVYLKYNLLTDEYSTCPKDIMMDLTELAISTYFNGNSTNPYLYIRQMFKVKSGSKNYTFFVEPGKNRSPIA